MKEREDRPPCQERKQRSQGYEGRGAQRGRLEIRDGHSRVAAMFSAMQLCCDAQVPTLIQRFYQSIILVNNLEMCRVGRLHH